MHGKEAAIAPLLQPLGLTVVVPPQFNTDQFGTFTREIARAGDQLTAARRKAEAALDHLGESLGLASEGSFGPHPAFPSIAYNRELVLLIDRQQGLEIVGQFVSTQTNYAHRQVNSLEAALQFAQQVGFPEHGLVVMPAAIADPSLIYKGIVDPAELQSAVEQTLHRHGQAHLETDMRAMVNPTRMQAIARATEDLVRKLQQRCPHCGTPGFELRERRPGLPCSWCHAPTEQAIAAIYVCQKCHFTQEQRYPDGVETADPSHCQYCNP